jgi:hypothetical protein
MTVCRFYTYKGFPAARSFFSSVVHSPPIYSFITASFKMGLKNLFVAAASLAAVVLAQSAPYGQCTFNRMM